MMAEWKMESELYRSCVAYTSLVALPFGYVCLFFITGIIFARPLPYDTDGLRFALWYLYATTLLCALVLPPLAVLGLLTSKLERLWGLFMVPTLFTTALVESWLDSSATITATAPLVVAGTSIGISTLLGGWGKTGVALGPDTSV